MLLIPAVWNDTLPELSDKKGKKNAGRSWRSKKNLLDVLCLTLLATVLTEFFRFPITSLRHFDRECDKKLLCFACHFQSTRSIESSDLWMVKFYCVLFILWTDEENDGKLWKILLKISCKLNSSCWKQDKNLRSKSDGWNYLLTEFD